MADNVNLEAVNKGLRSVKVLRSTVGELFRTLADGLKASHVDEGKDMQYLTELQSILSNINTRLRDLETAVTLLGTPPPQLHLGNTSHLSLDPTYDKSSLYTEMVKSFRWCDKVHEHSSHAHAILTQNSLKRSNVNPLLLAKRVRRTPHNGYNMSPQNVDTFIAGLQRLFPDMTVDVLRPFGSSAVLKVSLTRLNCSL
ncbi:mediator of RNA polymerase II transcription subunit 27-like, partial [Limulus polyphemus]|uniref:Mediator of RNA polymerase II transcription subunit 27-like n=1 Tax=Limulus polyphemus TaxID=6850 RepID=A0ABM1BLS4_LIMPO